MAILRNALVALEKEQIPIFRETITKVLESTEKSKIDCKEILMKSK